MVKPYDNHADGAHWHGEINNLARYQIYLTTNKPGASGPGRPSEGPKALGSGEKGRGSYGE